MRDRVERGRPRLTQSRVMAGLAALLVAVALGTFGCSSDSGVVPVPSASAPMVKSAPVRVQIPAIGVDSTVMELGLRADGTMQVPPAGFPAGWYSGAPTPGELGPAIIAGHVDWQGQPGVFYRLHDLKSGDEITVVRQDGRAAVFRVNRVEQFPKNKFPTDLVYGNIDHPGLRLITCGGSFNRQAHSYDDNIIAFADLDSSHTA